MDSIPLRWSSEGGQKIKNTSGKISSIEFCTTGYSDKKWISDKEKNFGETMVKIRSALNGEEALLWKSAEELFLIKNKIIVNNRWRVLLDILSWCMYSFYVITYSFCVFIAEDWFLIKYSFHYMRIGLFTEDYIFDLLLKTNFPVICWNAL